MTFALTLKSVYPRSIARSSWRERSAFSHLYDTRTAL